MVINTLQHKIKLLVLVSSFGCVIMSSLIVYSSEFNLAELKQVTVTGWMSDGTKGSVDLVEIEAFGLKNVAQDIGRLFNTTPKTKLNFTPDLSTMLTAYSLSIKVLASDGELTIRLITSDLVSLDNGKNEVFFQLKNEFASDAFVPSLEKLFFSQKKEYWMKMKEVTRLKNEF